MLPTQKSPLYPRSAPSNVSPLTNVRDYSLDGRRSRLNEVRAMSSGDTTRVSSIGNIDLRTATPSERHTPPIPGIQRRRSPAEVLKCDDHTGIRRRSRRSTPSVRVHRIHTKYKLVVNCNSNNHIIQKQLRKFPQNNLSTGDNWKIKCNIWWVSG